MNTDRIDKKILLSASRKRVRGAVSDSTEFGTWFDVQFDGPFVPEAKVYGVIVPTRVDAERSISQESFRKGAALTFRMSRRKTGAKVDNQVAAPTELGTPTMHRAKITQPRVRMEGWRQGGRART